MKRLFVPLKRKPFEAFEAGTKTWEIRRDEGAWAKAIPDMPVLLRLGYSGHREMHRVVGRIIRAPSAGQLMAALPSWHRAIPWAETLEQAAQSVRLMLLAGKHQGKPLIAIEILPPSNLPTGDKK